MKKKKSKSELIKIIILVIIGSLIATGVGIALAEFGFGAIIFIGLIAMCISYLTGGKGF